MREFQKFQPFQKFQAFQTVPDTSMRLLSSHLAFSHNVNL
jgi:hypothetical protein